MSGAAVASRYFAAVAARDLDTTLALWAPGGVERLLDPSAVWPGHTDPVTGDVAAQLERAATG